MPPRILTEDAFAKLTVPVSELNGTVSENLLFPEERDIIRELVRALDWENLPAGHWEVPVDRRFTHRLREAGLIEVCCGQRTRFGQSYFFARLTEHGYRWVFQAIEIDPDFDPQITPPATQPPPALPDPRGPQPARGSRDDPVTGDHLAGPIDPQDS